MRRYVSMSSCPEYKEILFLDIHGELDPGSRPRWQSHLRTCAACQQERLRMMQLVGKMKGVMSPPSLTREDRDGMVRALRAGMGPREGKRGEAGRWAWLSRPWRISPALVSACVFAAIISIWSLGSFDSFFKGDGVSGKDPLQGMRAEDEEIIRNLDLLKQLDSVERLVNTLDEPEEDPPPPERTSTVEGTTGYEKRVHDA